MGATFRNRVQVTFFLENDYKRRIETLAAVQGWRKAKAYRAVVWAGLRAIAREPELCAAFADDGVNSGNARPIDLSIDDLHDLAPEE